MKCMVKWLIFMGKSSLNGPTVIQKSIAPSQITIHQAFTCISPTTMLKSETELNVLVLLKVQSFTNLKILTILTE